MIRAAGQCSVNRHTANMVCWLRSRLVMVGTFSFFFFKPSLNLWLDQTIDMHRWSNQRRQSVMWMSLSPSSVYKRPSLVWCDASWLKTWLIWVVNRANFPESALERAMLHVIRRNYLITLHVVLWKAFILKTSCFRVVTVLFLNGSVVLSTHNGAKPSVWIWND